MFYVNLVIIWSLGKMKKGKCLAEMRWIYTVPIPRCPFPHQLLSLTWSPSFQFITANKLLVDFSFTSGTFSSRSPPPGLLPQVYPAICHGLLTEIFTLSVCPITSRSLFILHDCQVVQINDPDCSWSSNYTSICFVQSSVTSPVVTSSSDFK